MAENGANVILQAWSTILVPLFLLLNCKRKRRVLLQRFWKCPRTFSRYRIDPERALAARVTVPSFLCDALRLPMKLLPLLVLRRLCNLCLPVLTLSTHSARALALLMHVDTKFTQ